MTLVHRFYALSFFISYEKNVTKWFFCCFLILKMCLVTLLQNLAFTHSVKIIPQKANLCLDDPNIKASNSNLNFVFSVMVCKVILRISASLWLIALLCYYVELGGSGFLWSGNCGKRHFIIIFPYALTLIFHAEYYNWPPGGEIVSVHKWYQQGRREGVFNAMTGDGVLEKHT